MCNIRQKVETGIIQSRNKFATDKEHHEEHNLFPGKQKPVHFSPMTEFFLSLAFSSMIREENFMSMDKPAIPLPLGSAPSNVKFFTFASSFNPRCKTKEQHLLFA